MAITSQPGQLSNGLSNYPPRLVAGIGCNRGTGADEIIALVLAALAASNATADDLCAIGTLDRKAGEPGLHAAAAHFGVPLRLFSADDLEIAAALSPGGSAVVAAHIGIPSLAEAVALKAGTLLAGKRKSAHATCALSLCGNGFDLASFGRPAAAIYNSSAAIASSMLATSLAGP